MKIFAETERLLLREILLTDINGMYQLDSDPEVRRYVGKNHVTSMQQSVDAINLIRQQYVENGIGRWAIIDKKTFDFIGWTGLKLVKAEINNHTNYYDLGYRLIQKYWGSGIATESAIASLEYAFNTLQIPEVFAIAECENIASNKILQKVGLHFIETFNLDGIDHNWYKIDKKQFVEFQIKKYNR